MTHDLPEIPLSNIFRPIPDLTISGSGVAYPGPALSNAEVYRRLLGEDWRARLEQRGDSPDHAETRWGIRTRHWCGAAEEATGRCTATLERWIRERPTQWAWMYERWKPPPVAGAGELGPAPAQRLGATR